MNRIDKLFEGLKKEKKKAFIPYITAGDPDMKTTKKLVIALANAGADIIELGIPFSDPLADGLTIQAAINRSLKSGTTVKKVLGLVREIRKTEDVPLVFMTYYNIIFNYGVDLFVAEIKSAGVDGVIVPDLPIEEAGDLLKATDKLGVCLIQLTAPTTSIERFKKIAKCSRGFIYYVSLTGVTGMRKTLSHDLKSTMKKLKKVTNKPICVGFGISDPKQAKSASLLADGAIVGSAIIKIIEKHLGDKKRMVNSVVKFARSISRAVK